MFEVKDYPERLAPKAALTSLAQVKDKRFKNVVEEGKPVEAYDTLIKIKPTALYVLFGAALFVGLWLKKPLLKILFDGALHVTEEGWRKLTWRWAFFFLVLAVLNEIVWRTQSTDFWVNFKVFGVVPLTFVFAALQYPLLQKYAAPEPTEAKDRR